MCEGLIDAAHCDTILFEAKHTIKETGYGLDQYLLVTSAPKEVLQRPLSSDHQHKQWHLDFAPLVGQRPFQKSVLEFGRILNSTVFFFLNLPIKRLKQQTAKHIIQTFITSSIIAPFNGSAEIKKSKIISCI